MSEEQAFRHIGPTRDSGTGRGVLAVLSDHVGRVLLHLRDDIPDIPHPGMWSFFGGAVEDGESLREAIVRELAEELTIDVPPDALRPYVRLISDSFRRSRMFIFHAKLRLSPGDIRLEEGAGFGFFTEAQAVALPFPPLLKPVLTEYFDTQRKNPTEPTPISVS